MSSPKKKTITVMCEDISTCAFEGTLEVVRARIDELITKHGPKARLDWNRYFYYDYDPEPSPRFELFVDREETDAEFEERIAKEKKIAEEQEKRDREELERLKKKLGVK